MVRKILKIYLKIFIFFGLLSNLPIFGNINFKRNISFLKNEKSISKIENTSNKKEFIQKLNFSEIREKLINNNLELKVIQSQIEQAKRNLKANYSSWYPRLILKSDELPKYITSDSRQTLNENTSSNQLKVGVNALLEFDLINPKRRLEIKISKEKLENLENVYKSNLENLYLRAVEIYFSILSAEQEIKMANQSIKISEITMKEYENRFKNGISNKLELLEVKTQLNRDKIILLNKKDQLAFNKNKLVEILNLNNQISLEGLQYDKIINIWDHKDLKSKASALEHSYDLKVKKKKIDINKKEALSLISGKKPNFVIYNNFSISNANGETGVSNPDFNKITKNNTNTIGLKFNLNLFDGGNVKQRYLSLNERSNELESDYNFAKNALIKEINDKLVQYNTIKDKIIYSKDQLKFAKESLMISLKRLDAGLATQREIVNIQGDVIEAETNFINALKAYKITIASLKKLTTLEPQNICQLNSQQNIKSEFLSYLKNNNLMSKC